MAGFPKILVVSADPFNRTSGTGITISNIFKGWDKDRIANVYIHDVPRSDEVCDKYYRLSKWAFFFNYCLKWLMVLFQLRKVKIVQTTVPLKKSERTFKNIMFLNFKAGFDLSPMFVSKSFWKWVQEYDPDIIYSMLGNGRMIKFSNSIAARTKKPVLPHFMDDWPECIYIQNEWGGYARKMFDKMFKQVIAYSKGGLCISDQMTEEYIKRYKIPFATILNCVEEEFFIQPEERTSAKQPTVFLYVGGLHLNRWMSLLEIAEAIDEINQEGQQVQLHIYCPEKDRNQFADKFNNNKSVSFKGSVSSTQVPEVLSQASVLIHVESFEENVVLFTKYSISTKIPQYMAAGKPILAYGPGELASVQHVVNAHAGYAVTSKDKAELKKKILTLSANPELRFSCANNGYQFAKANHSQSKTLKTLQKVAQEYANSH
ncbi:glycosyltransferase [Emticicia sp. 17c]|uniref:glycosyltransferase n=1 Tax=Emticicia sp. 17c TaxID=3127704 RepID=UPI00301BBBD6